MALLFYRKQGSTVFRGGLLFKRAYYILCFQSGYCRLRVLASLFLSVCENADASEEAMNRNKLCRAPTIENNLKHLYSIIVKYPNMKLFISYNSKNRVFVEPIAKFLENSGFDVFYDKASIEAGDIWLEVIQKGIEGSNASLVFIGDEGIGGWQNKEVLTIVNDSVRKNSYKIIPIILPIRNQQITFRLPWFLADYEWVEFRNSADPNALSKLLKGLQGKQDSRLLGRNPYKGLDSFGVDDDLSFCGRDYDLNLVFYNNLRLNDSIVNHNFLAVVADSGTGKTSFVKAGIMAALKKGRFDGSEKWKHLIFNPGQNPLSSLSSQLVIEKLIVDSRQFEDNAKLYDDELLRRIRDQRETWIIYVDQFEEVITQCKNEEERTVFLNNLVRLKGMEKVILLISLRSDFYTAFSSYPQFKVILERCNVTLPSIDIIEKDDLQSFKALRDIIEIPATNAGVTVSQELVENLIQDLRSVRGKLPILQLALDLLWKQKADPSKITLDDYAKISGNRNLTGIIQVHADNVYKSFTNNGTDEHKVSLFKKIFVPNLIQVAGTGQDIRRIASKEELLNTKGYNKGEIFNLLQNLSSEKARLITMRAIKDQISVEVVHEVLIREWPLLQEWIDERRDALMYQQRIREDVVSWQNGKHELYSSRDLEKALLWERQNQDLSDSVIENFLAESKTEIHRQKKESSNRNTKKLMLVSGTLLLALWLAHTFWYKENKFRQDLEKSQGLTSTVYAYGGDLNSVKTLRLDSSDFKICKDNFNFFPGLDSLILVGNIGAENLSFAKNSNLTYLEIRDCQTILDLSGLKKGESLKEISISNVTNLISLAVGKKYVNVNSIYLNGKTGIKDLTGFEEFSTLTTLLLENSIGNLLGISKLRQLKSLKVTGDISSYAGVENLDQLLSLSVPDVGELIELGAFQKLISLRSLSVEVGEISNLRAFEKLTRLNSFSISGVMTLQTLDGIEQLKSLKRLEFIGGFDFNSLASLRGLDSLEYLYLGWSSSIRDLNDLRGLPSLRCLEFRNNTGIQDISGVEELQSLDSLIIHPGQSFGRNSIFKNVRSNSLKYLYYDLSFGANDMSWVSGFPSLETLIISNFEGLSSLNDIERAKNLKSLTISGCPELTDLSRLSAMKNIKNIELTGVPKVVNLQVFSTLPTLKYLTLRNVPSLEEIVSFDGLDSLSQLTLEGNFGLSTINKFEQLRSLTALRLEGNINLQDVSGIEALASLKSLTLNGNLKLKDVGWITKLHSLESLSIGIAGNEAFDLGERVYFLNKIKILSFPSSLNWDPRRLVNRNPEIKILRKTVLSEEK